MMKDEILLAFAFYELGLFGLIAEWHYLDVY